VLFKKECREQFRTALADPKGKRQEPFIIPLSASIKKNPEEVVVALMFNHSQ